MNRSKLLKAILLISLFLNASLAIIGAIAYRPIVDQISYIKIANEAGIAPSSVKNAIKSGKKIVPLNSDKTILLQIDNNQGTAPLTEFLADYGWKLGERMGGMIFYKKNGANLNVRIESAGFLWKGYVMYKLEKAP